MKSIIMAGGKGTRLANVLGDNVPKPMAIIAGKPILQHQIEMLSQQGVNEFVLVIGHLGHVIQNFFGDGSKFGVSIEYIVEKEPMGTAGALYYLKNKIEDYTLLVFGDVFCDFSVNRMLNFAKSKQASITLFTHPNSHPYDSDLIITDEEKKVVKWDSKNNVRDYDYDNNVNAGIYVITNKVLDYITEPKKIDLEKDIIINMIARKDGVFSYQSTEYVKDAGTPDRYESVEKDYLSGVVHAKNLLKKQACVFLDRDGVINRHIGFVNNPDQIELIDGVTEAIKLLNRSKYLSIVVTNQPVVARGECSFEMLNSIHNRIKTLLGEHGCYIDALYFCPHHTDSGFDGEVKELKFDCDCRKPKPGMILQAVEDFNIDVKQCILFGDNKSDVLAGENAGIEKCHLIDANADNVLLANVKKLLGVEN